jgi:hypothetical protein
VSADVTELKQDIEQHRAELAATVDLLADKLNVKSRLQARLVELKPVAVPAAGAVAALVLVVTVVRRRRS